MATSINNSGITFPDNTTQTTAATGSSTTYGAVGSYTWAVLNNGIYTGNNYVGGDTFPGSALWPCAITNSSGLGYYPVLDFIIGTTNYSGTWQLMTINRGSIFGDGREASLFVRIS